MKNRLGITWLIVVVVEVVLAAVLMVVVVPLVVDDAISRQVVDPNWLIRNRAAAKELTPYLVATLQLASAAALLIPVVFTVLWFAYLWNKRVDRPGQSSTAFVAWLLLLSVGTLVAVSAAGALLQSSYLQLLLNEDLSDIFDRITVGTRVAVGSAMLAFFWISFCVATFMATPPLFRTAVPFASRLGAA
jgi:hypothetical protein